MDAASIFVLCLAAGFFGCIAYLALRSRRRVEPAAKEEDHKTRRAA
jgi:hypothetical protein